MNRAPSTASITSPLQVIAEVYKGLRVYDRLLLGRRRTFLALALLVLATSVLDAVGIALVMPIIAALQGREETVSAWIDLFPTLEQEPIVVMAVLLALVFAVKNGLVLVRSWWSLNFLHGLGQRWTEQIVDNLLFAPLDFRVGPKSGGLVATAFGETNESVEALLKCLQFTVSIFTFLSIYTVLWLSSWQVTLAITFSMIVFGLFGFRPLARLAHSAGSRQVKWLNLSSSFFLEIVGGLRYIQAFSKESYFAQAMSSPLREWRRAQVATRWVANFIHPLIETIVVFSLCAAVILVSRRAPTELARSLPLLGVFAAAAFRLFPVLTGLGAQWVSVISKQASARRVLEHIGPPPRETDGRPRFGRLDRSIAFENVHFTYPDRPPALVGISLEMEKGCRTALVGESGSGKTTVVSLLTGFLRPDHGKVLVDGLPLEHFRLDSWRRVMGYVGQEGFVFHTTLAENICLGRVSKDDPRIVEAARVVGFHDFVQTLPEGYATVVGERGVLLSGGQRQRLALARAILMRPEILILDEPISALDNESVVSVLKALADFLQESTWLFVAHRLSTITGFDSILVLRNGRLVERGSHTELTKREGYYHQLFDAERASQGAS